MTGALVRILTVGSIALAGLVVWCVVHRVDGTTPDRSDAAGQDSLIYLYPDGRRAGGHSLMPGDSVEVCAHLQRGDSVWPLPESHSIEWRTLGALRPSSRGRHCIWLIAAPQPVQVHT